MKEKAKEDEKMIHPHFFSPIRSARSPLKWRATQKGRWRGGFILSILILSLSSVVHAVTDIFLHIQRGKMVTIGFPEFVSKNSTELEKNATREIQNVTRDDILFSRLFNLQEEGPVVGDGKIDFIGWEKAGADILITATVFAKEEKIKEKSKIDMIASVYELPEGNPVFQNRYSGSLKQGREIAHKFVADFLYRFTGHRGVSASKIVFSNNATGAKELYLIDYDGHNLRRITNDKNIALLPRWSPDGDAILYTTFKSGNPDLYIYSLKTGTFKAISLRRGLNTSAAFSPDGKSIVTTLSYEGSPNLYLLDTSGKILRRLTQSKGADTSPAFSPDGRKIIFTSDRPGWPQIYMMDTDGSNVKRITDSGYCDAPAWSPTGEKIAYSKGTDKGQHDIVVLDLSTGKEIQLTSNSGRNENPSFSPDGRFLVFTSNRNKKRELYIASVDGAVQKKVAEMEGDCFTPSWGP